MTYYDVLEVNENASLEVIHMAYKVLAKKYHPDLYKGDLKIAEEHMKQINIAHGVLSDPEKRAQYDSFLRWQRSQTQNETSGTSGETKGEKKPKKEKTPPSFQKSSVTVCLLLLLAFTLEVFVYIWEYNRGQFRLNHALFCAFWDTAVFTFAYMFFPLLIGALKEECSLNFIDKLSWINSVVMLIFWNAILSQSLSDGWGLAIIYSFINRHTLYHMHQLIPRRKHRVIGICIFFVGLLYTIVLGILGLSALF